MIDLRKTQQQKSLTHFDSIVIERNVLSQYYSVIKSMGYILSTMYETTKTMKKQSPTMYDGVKYIFISHRMPTKQGFTHIFAFRRSTKSVFLPILPFRMWSADVLFQFLSFRSTTETHKYIL